MCEFNTNVQSSNSWRLTIVSAKPKIHSPRRGYLSPGNSIVLEKETALLFISVITYISPLMSRNAHDDKNGRFGERAARLTILAKLAILAIFCQFRQISSSIGIDNTRVNIGEFGDFGDFDKFGNFGDVLPISSN